MEMAIFIVLAYAVLIGFMSWQVAKMRSEAHRERDDMDARHERQCMAQPFESALHVHLAGMELHGGNGDRSGMTVLIDRKSVV